MSEVNKIYLLRGNDTPLSVCLRKREGDGDPVPYDLSEAERIRLALVGHGAHVFASGVTVSGEDNNIVSGVIPGRALLKGDYDLEVTFRSGGCDKRFAVEDMFEAVDFLAEDADGETEGEGAGIFVTVTVQPELIEISGPVGPQGPKGDTPVLSADEDGTIYADGVLLTEVVKDAAEIAIEAAQEAEEAAETIDAKIAGKADESEVLPTQASLAEPRFRPMSVTEDTIGYYINASSGQWESSSSADSYMLPIIPGRRYYVRAYGIRNGRIAVLASDEHQVGTVPSYAEGFNTFVTIPAGEDYSFVAPANAQYMNVASKLSGNSVRPSYIMEEMSVEETMTASSINIVSGCPLRYVDARVDSATFGMSVNATNDDWGASDLVCVRGCKRLKYHRVVFSTSANYAGKAGDVFFDKNFQPITDGAHIIQRAGTALQTWVEVDVPENAWYFRRTYITHSVPTELYLISDSNEGSFRYQESISQKSCVYFGQRIDLGNSFDYTRFATNGVSGMQSAAVFGDKLFLISNKLAKIVLYDLKTLTQVYTLTTDITPESHWHCNQASFSSKFVDETDPFPVLYLSMQNNGDGRCEAHGYRIIPVYTDGEISSFTITLVQKVFLPVMTDENCLGNANVTFDTQKGWMWTYSRNMNEQAANNGKARLTRFAIPELTESTVTLEDSDILEAFSDDFNMALAQGGFIHNGKLVIFQGYASAGYINCHVVDLYLEKKRVSWIDMLGDGFVMEPEGAFWYDGKIHFTTATVHMYRLNL